MNRKVAIVLKTGAGGLWVIPQIRALRKAGAKVAVVIPDEGGRLSDILDELSATDTGVTVIRTEYRFSFRPTLRNVTQFTRFGRQLRSLEVEAVLYHLYASALAARFALMGRRLKRVHMVAGPLFLESRIVRFVERILQRLDDVIICGSDDILRRYRQIGVSSGRLVTIPYGVDTATFRPEEGWSRSRARSELGLSADAFVAVMVAFVYAPKRLTHNGRGIKGHAELLSAWRVFHAAHPEARLVIVGGGFREDGEAYRQEILSALSRPLDEMGIIWLASMSDVRGVYAAADVSVSPSLSENHGAALEASAMAVPSIVSDAGGLPETVDAGETGWIVPAGDSHSLATALEEAFSVWRRGELARMGSAAREKAEALFDSSAAAERVAQIILDGGASD